jgi:hypothetical protein
MRPEEWTVGRGEGDYLPLPGPATARPQACDLRNDLISCFVVAGCFGRCRADRFATDQKVGGSNPFGRALS